VWRGAVEGDSVWRGAVGGDIVTLYREREGKRGHSTATRDCHGYTRGNPWAFKRAQEEPKRIRNEGAMVKTVFGPYLLHYLSIWALLGLV
jgi:hypothetical protein